MGEAFAILAGFDDVKSCDWLACRDEDTNKHHNARDSDISGSASKRRTVGVSQLILCTTAWSK
jgi:hypothetical protein